MAFFDWLNPLVSCGGEGAGDDQRIVAAHICPLSYSYWVVVENPPPSPRTAQDEPLGVPADGAHMLGTSP